jgi:hypothetical protein
MRAGQNPKVFWGLMQGLQLDGFRIVPGVLGRREVDGLIRALSEIDEEQGVRSRGGVYAVRNLLEWHLRPSGWRDRP